MKNSLSYIKTLLLEEADRWVLWLPVFFGAGIAAYFALDSEPSTQKVAGMFAGALALLLISRRMHPAVRLAVFALWVAVAGFSLAKINTELSDAPRIYEMKEPITISGNIERISYSSGFPVLVLRNLRIDGVDRRYLPEKIRLNVRTKFKEEVRPGDRIITDAYLMPPARPVVPGGYDFARGAYFNQIGANGFAIKPIVKLKKGGEQSLIEDMRYEISQRIRAATSGDKGAVSEALITGERAYISKETYENMRKAGLAHLLAVSGMNLALVAAIMFFVVRSLFALSYRLSELYSAKKLAAVIAILCNVFYLLVSGGQPSVVRAFIMVSIIMLGILLDRAATPMRSVAFSALVIMAVDPASLLNPGFQMSFAAVAALIAVYEIIMKRITAFDPDKVADDTERWYRKFYNKLWLYPLSVMLTSAIAGAATSPFSAYHFNQISNIHGVVANLMAVPLVSFAVMPFAVLGMALMPFGLEHIGFVPMSYGVDAILWIAEKTASQPNSTVPVLQMQAYALALIVMGGLWFLVWQKRWRYLGLVLILAGMLAPAGGRMPDIIINETGKLFAINRDGELHFSNLRSSFASREWLAQYAQKKALRLEKQEVYEIKGHKFKPGCGADAKAGYTINDRCITAEMLKKKGTHNIYLSDSKIVVETVADKRGKRPWTK